MDLETLVRSARDGDRAAFGSIVRRFQDVAFGGAFSWLGDAEEARDAAQDAFVEAWEKLANLQEPAAFPGWFRRIVIKQVDRHLRRRHPQVSADVLDGLHSPLPDPLTLIETHEVQDVVRAAIASLPEGQRLPLTLFHLEGHRQKDVAAFLELPVSTVKKRIFDARRALQEKVLHMVDQTVDQARPSRDDGFARKVEFWLAFEDRDVIAMGRLLDADPYLLEAKSDWESAPWLRSSGSEVTAATWAVHIDDTRMLEMLLDRGADIDRPGGDGDGLLMTAVMDFKPEIVRLLLRRGADVNQPGGCSQTPLHRAIIGGDPEVCALLVEAGADLEAEDHRNRTPADWAAMKGRSELLAWLVDRGARPNRVPARQIRHLRMPPSSSNKIPSGQSLLGKWVDVRGHAGPAGPEATETRHADVSRELSPVLETGLKAIDLVAPFTRGGHVAIDAGLGAGKSLLTEQLARNVVESYDARVVYVSSISGRAEYDDHMLEWRSFVADGRFLMAHTTHVLAEQSKPETYADAAATGLSIAENLRRDGHDVLLYVETPIALTDGVLAMLRSQAGYSPDAAITTCYLGQIPHSIDQEAFQFLDAAVRMDVRRARDGTFPAIDLELSTSRLLSDELLDREHRAVVEQARPYVRALGTHNLRVDGPPTRSLLAHVSECDQVLAEQLMTRSLRLDRFLTQPYHGTEMWMGEPGETVAMADAVEGIRQIISGMHDDIPAAAFGYVGTIDQVLEKSTRL